MGHKLRGLIVSADGDAGRRPHAGSDLSGVARSPAKGLHRVDRVGNGPADTGRKGSSIGVREGDRWRKLIIGVSVHAPLKVARIVASPAVYDYSRWRRHGDPLAPVRSYRRPGVAVAPSPTRYCSEEGCRRRHYGRALCRLHYDRWRRHWLKAGMARSAADPDS